MTRLPKGLVLALLACALVPSAARAVPLCKVNQFVSLNMETEPDGEVAIPVKIDDRDANLIVDTGSIYSSVTADTVEDLHLEYQGIPPGMFAYAAGVGVTHMAVLRTLRIGKLTTANYPLIIEPERIQQFDVDGLIGPDIMLNYDVELDFAGGKFNLFHWDSCDGRDVYWSGAPFETLSMSVDQQWHLITSAALDGKSLPVLLDTGAETSFMSLGEAKHLFGITETTPGLVSLGVHKINGTSTPAYRYPFATLSFGGLTLKNPDIMIVPDAIMFEGEPMSIGINLLRRMRMYISYKREVLYVAPAEAKLGEPVDPAAPIASAPTASLTASPATAAPAAH